MKNTKISLLTSVFTTIWYIKKMSRLKYFVILVLLKRIASQCFDAKLRCFNQDFIWLKLSKITSISLVPDMLINSLSLNIEFAAASKLECH